MNAANRTTARKGNGRLDRALLLAIFAVLGGLFWQMFSMNERHTRDFAELNASLSGNIAALSERHSRDFAELNVKIAESGERHSREIAELNVRLSSDIEELSVRLARIETLLQYLVPRPANPPDAGL